MLLFFEGFDEREDVITILQTVWGRTVPRAKYIMQSATDNWKMSYAHAHTDNLILAEFKFPHFLIELSP
jgi:hypothetical protein